MALPARMAVVCPLTVVIFRPPWRNIAFACMQYAKAAAALQDESDDETLQMEDTAQVSRAFELPSRMAASTSAARPMGSTTRAAASIARLRARACDSGSALSVCVFVP